MVKFVKCNIPHIKQRFDWDCGIACVLMLLSEKQRNYFSKHFLEICQQEGFGTNTWTIDISYLLKRFEVNHRLYTTRRAPNCKAGSSGKKLTVNDADRIKNRFAKAVANNIIIIDGALSTKALIEHVATTGPALVLIDEALLSCDLCKHNKLSSEIRRVFGGRYRGHYVLVVEVVGFRRGDYKLLYRDPARSASVCATTPRRLNAARLVPYTDCDVILIDNKY
ncbi:protein GUCD1 [Danaus plexippus]|uniref:protein GUCD1 n=1 Tax=Danaus plexippus TaxID=13037 RepID=UPI002AB13455|nr:protein GUCD1 [Danaus plexippus]XP_061382611.1 protein GUCD1 [Danaus plexippus]